MHHRIGEADPLAVSLREPPDDFHLHFAKAAELKHVADPVVHPPARHALERGAVAEKLMDAHVRVERNIFRQVADMLAGPEGFAEDIAASHLGLARCWRKEPRQHAHRGAFSGPVRPEESDDLAFAHLEINRIHCRGGPVAFGELFDFDHWIEPWRINFAGPCCKATVIQIRRDNAAGRGILAGWKSCKRWVWHLG